MKLSFVSVSGLALILAACGQGKAPEESATAPSSEAMPVAAFQPEGGAAPEAQPVEAEEIAAADTKPAAFAQCAACHAVEEGKHGVGPSLAGVFGAKAGQTSGFTYSAAMLKSGFTWDEVTLDTYLAAPMTTVPGTKMSFAGLKDADKRKEMIEYLKTL